MKEYLIKYNSNCIEQEVTVIATSITHALDLVDLSNKDNIYYNGITDCKFIKNINTLLIEDVN